MAGVLGNKTVAQVRSFVLGARRRLGLERLLRERDPPGAPPGPGQQQEVSGEGGGGDWDQRLPQGEGWARLRSSGGDWGRSQPQPKDWSQFCPRSQS